MGVTVRVNEIEHEVATHERSPLLWVLRDELNCTSAKYGCGAEQCGACRVLLDGMPAFSCSVTIAEVSGRDVTTLEGLVADGRAAPVAEAMVARETRLLHRPDQRVLGAAEAVTGPTPAAIANAVFQATGARLRQLPLSPERVLAALDALVASPD